MSRVTASIIVPSYNKLSRLRFVLASFAHQAGDFEIVVCNDGSTDGTEEYLRDVHLPYHLSVVSGLHEGAASARNRAAQSAEGDVLIFSDDDMVPAPGFVDHHVQACTDADVLSRGVRWSVPVTEVDGLMELAGDWEGCVTVWSHARLTVAEDFAVKTLRGETPFPYRFLQSCTSNMAVRRETFERLGAFDRRFGTGWGGEDTEFGYRAQLDGVPLVQTVGAQNLHLEHSTDSGAKFRKGVDNFALFEEMYPNDRTVRAIVTYIKHAVATDTAAELFDEQAFIPQIRPEFDFVKAS